MLSVAIVVIAVGLATLVVAARVFPAHKGGAALAFATVVGGSMWWSGAYALELSAPARPEHELWGGAKYIGVCAVAAGWLVHGLFYSGRGRWVTKPLLAALAIEPAIVLCTLILPQTRHWMRPYPADLASLVVLDGPMYWPHLAYTQAIVLVGMMLHLSRLSPHDGGGKARRAMVVAGIVAPLLANFWYSLSLPPFDLIDPTPFMVTAMAAPLLWGLAPQLKEQQDVVRMRLLASLIHPTIVADRQRQVIEVNDAAVTLLGRRGHLIGRDLADVLPGQLELAPRGTVDGSVARARTTLRDQGRLIAYDGVRQPLRGHRGELDGEVLTLYPHSCDAVEVGSAAQFMTALKAANIAGAPRRRTARLQHSAYHHSDLHVVLPNDSTWRRGSFADVLEHEDGRRSLLFGELATLGVSQPAATIVWVTWLRTLVMQNPDAQWVLRTVCEQARQRGISTDGVRLSVVTLAPRPQAVHVDCAHLGTPALVGIVADGRACTPLPHRACVVAQGLTVRGASCDVLSGNGLLVAGVYPPEDRAEGTGTRPPATSRNHGSLVTEGLVLAAAAAAGRVNDADAVQGIAVQLTHEGCRPLVAHVGVRAGVVVDLTAAG